MLSRTSLTVEMHFTPGGARGLRLRQARGARLGPTSTGQRPDRLACSLRRAWTGVHGQACMDRRAWTGVHGQACMDRRAWTGVHGQACMDRRAWLFGHGPKCSTLSLGQGSVVKNPAEADAYRSVPGQAAFRTRTQVLTVSLGQGSVVKNPAEADAYRCVPGQPTCQADDTVVGAGVAVHRDLHAGGQRKRVGAFSGGRNNASARTQSDMGSPHRSAHTWAERLSGGSAQHNCKNFVCLGTEPCHSRTVMAQRPVI
eukprot:349776-Chlamydomonas_euryale.AAC.5